MPNAPTPPRDPDTDFRKPAAESPTPKTGKLSKPPRRLSPLFARFYSQVLMFPRLYTDVVIPSAPNSNGAKILAPHYKKLLPYTERTTQMSHPNPVLISRSPASAAAPPHSAESSSATSTSACSAPSDFPPPASSAPPSSRTPNPSRPPSWKSSTTAPRHPRTQARRTHPPRPQHRRPQHPPRPLRPPPGRMVARSPTTPTRPRTVDEQYAAEPPRRPPPAESPAPPRRSPGRILRWPRQNPPTPAKTNPTHPHPHTDHCGDGRSRPSRRPRSTGPQCSATEACPSHNPQAATRRERSYEGAHGMQPTARSRG